MGSALEIYGAMDLGASSVRLMAGQLVNDKLVLEEIVRLPNRPTWMTGGLRWDLVAIYQGLLEGVAQLSRGALGELVSLGIDGWGNDYGLLDGDGQLIGLPFHYRDQRTRGRVEQADRLVGLSRIYQATGIQVLAFNTLYQLLAERESAAYQSAAQLLLVPDLMAYFLTGERRLERTNASTTQLVDARTGRLVDWMLEVLGLRRDLFPAPISPGEPLGELRADVAQNLGLRGRPLVTAVASHDTASAVLAAPATGESFAYVISGTWNLVGLELEVPVINEESLRANFSNELGIEATVRFLRNVMGHWMLQECGRTWSQAGRRVDRQELFAAAELCAPFRSLVDTGIAEFAQPGDMPTRVRAACTRTGEPVPETDAELVRCILDSMAVAIAEAVSEASRLACRDPDVVHVLGGGAANWLLMSLVAAATGREVLAGPVEGSSVGNILVQLQVAGYVKGRAALRELVRRSLPPARVMPDASLAALAERARDRLCAIRSKGLVVQQN